ncbi:MAG: Uma2 family endonuclease [Isosphaeraceae bacterium]|nr:Uma2 family endonuclease [Isosphaeraceae bacterium]
MGTAETHAPARPAAVAEERILVRDVDWATYQKLAEAIGDQPILIAYNQGDLELMSPGPLHEDYKGQLRRLIEVVTEERGIPCKNLGSTRWEQPAALRGWEADEYFYLTAEKIRAARSRTNDAADYPVPELASEIDLRPSQLDRPGIYAALGVPEVWRFDGEALWIDQLGADGTYRAATESQLLPISPAEVARWLRLEESDDDHEWARRFRAWFRGDEPPLRR